MQKRLRDFEIGLCTEPSRASDGDRIYILSRRTYRLEYTVEALLVTQIEYRM